MPPISQPQTTESSQRVTLQKPYTNYIIAMLPTHGQVKLHVGDSRQAGFSRAINSAYYEAIHWRHNLFQVLWGKVGTSFMTELASLFHGYGESSALELVALRATMVMPILLLQKPHARSKAKDHLKCYCSMIPSR